MYKIHFVSTFANILIIYYNSWCLINKYIIFLLLSRRRIYIEKFIKKEEKLCIQSMFIKILYKNNSYYLGII